MPWLPENIETVHHGLQYTFPALPSFLNPPSLFRFPLSAPAPPPLPSQFVQIERIEAPPTLLLFALHKLLLDKEAKSVKEVSGFPEEVRVMGEGVKGMLELV